MTLSSKDKRLLGVALGDKDAAERIAEEISSAGDAAGYTPENNNNWDTPPTTTSEALDELSSRVNTAEINVSDALTTAEDANTTASNALNAANDRIRLLKVSTFAGQLNDSGGGPGSGSGVAVIAGQIPGGSIILRTFIQVTESFVDNGTAGNANTSTIKVGVGAVPEAIKASAAFTTLTTGLVGCVQDGAVANMYKVPIIGGSYDVTITWTAGSGDSTEVTAGEMFVYIEYVPGS